jgi:hypothetical protein
VFTYTNMKLLYQSLRVFATGGSKWWGGQWGKAMFSYIRDELKDSSWGQARSLGDRNLDFSRALSAVINTLSTTYPLFFTHYSHTIVVW